MTSPPAPVRLLETVEVVFFDLFHTLTTIVTSPVRGPTTAEVLGLEREAWVDRLWQGPDDRLRGRLQDPVAILRSVLTGHEVTPGRLEEAARARERLFHDSLQYADEAVLAPLRILRERGLTLGLISNADPVEIAGWPTSPLAPLFDSVTFSCAVGWVKPEPEIYLSAMGHHGVPADRCLFVGDGGSNELAGAAAVGMTPVLTTGFLEQLWPELVEARRAAARYEIATLAQLLILEADG